MAKIHTAFVRLLLLAGLCVATPSFAQEDPQAQDAADSRSESFVAVEGAVKEDIAGGPLMLGAYAVTWVLLFLYVARLVSMQQRTLKEVQRLSTVLERAGNGERE